MGLQGCHDGRDVLLPLNQLAQDLCGVGLSDPLTDFVLALVLRPPFPDPLLGGSALGGIDMIEHAVETGAVTTAHKTGSTLAACLA